MVKGSMWRNLGCSQQPFLLSNEFFSLGSLSYKVCSVQQAGECASFPKVPAGSYGEFLTAVLLVLQLSRFTLVFFPRNALFCPKGTRGLP